MALLNIMEEVAKEMEEPRGNWKLKRALVPIEKDLKKSKSPSIEKEKETELFTGEEAIEKINKEIHNSYRTFIEQLRKTNINPDYIDFMQIGVTSVEDLIYDTNSDEEKASCIRNPDSLKSNVILRKKILISNFVELRKAEELQELTDEELRNLVVRRILYHELAHSVQRSYIFLNNEIVRKKGGLHINKHEGLDMLGSKFFEKMIEGYDNTDTKEFSIKKDSFSESEKQAEGLTFYLLENEDPRNYVLREIDRRSVEKSRKVIGKILGAIVIAKKQGNISYEEALNRLLVASSLNNLNGVYEKLWEIRLPYRLGLLYPKSRTNMEPFFEKLGEKPTYEHPKIVDAQET